jgi:hypothetical protein
MAPKVSIENIGYGYRVMSMVEGNLDYTTRDGGIRVVKEKDEGSSQFQ